MTVTRVLSWFYEKASVLNTAKGLNIQPRESSAPIIIDFHPATLGRVIDVGLCLDKLDPQHRLTVDRAFTEPEPDRERLFESDSFRADYFTALGRLGVIMRRRGIIH